MRNKYRVVPCEVVTEDLTRRISEAHAAAILQRQRSPVVDQPQSHALRVRCNETTDGEAAHGQE